MKIYNFTSSILHSVQLFFPEIHGKKIEDCVCCTYSPTNLFVMKITFYMWNFKEGPEFENNLAKLITFFKEEGLLDLKDLVPPTIVDKSQSNSFEVCKRTDYREYYFQVTSNLIQNMET